MRWLPERMPFSYRLLLAFTVPLLIWVLVSAASVYTLHRTQENYDALANAERTIALAHEYRSTVDVVLEAERAYLLTSSSQYLVEHREVMRRATALQDELGWRVRAQPEQVQRLERAGEVLQQWFYDYSRQRIEARRSLPYLGVRDAHLILQHMLAMLADEGDALPGEDLDELRGVLTALGEHAGEGRGAQVVQQAIEQLKRFESAASANDRAAAIDELRAVANHLLPALTGIIDAEHELYLMAMDERGSALVDEFNELVSTFIAEEQLIVERHRSRATMAAVTIHWIIWTGLAAGVILMLIVLIWFVRRLGDSIESIDHAAEELAKGNFGARARGEGSQQGR
ncbi:MAG: CHASE3 domain-containing protein [Proteobacteria bacterium]|nr:CHASE3 domain-containing protein [Pseudomonadota bacterium]